MGAKNLIFPWWIPQSPGALQQQQEHRMCQLGPAWRGEEMWQSQKKHLGFGWICKLMSMMILGDFLWWFWVTARCFWPATSWTSHSIQDPAGEKEQELVWNGKSQGFEMFTCAPNTLWGVCVCADPKNNPNGSSLRSCLELHRLLVSTFWPYQAAWKVEKVLETADPPAI